MADKIGSFTDKWKEWKMPKKKRLPKKMFMRWNDDGSEGFWDCSHEADLLADKDDTVEAGLYELKKIVKLKNSTEIL